MKTLRTVLMLFTLLLAARVSAAPTVEEYYHSYTVTTSNTPVTLPFRGCPVLVNRGATDAHFTFASTVATASSPLLPASERWGQCVTSTSTIGLITTSGSTTVGVYAWSSSN